MCRFKSGIILKNKVVLAPIYNDSHSRLLEKLNIEDSDFNAMTKFIRAELVPPNKDMSTDPKTWKFVVDQDVVPDWYKEDPERYETEFRIAVEEWVKEHISIIAGKAWISIKTNEKGTYYLMANYLEKSKFGKNNNYAESIIREKLNNSELANELRKEFGDRLVPISTNLTALDGLKDYETIEGDILAIPTLDLYRECRENINNIDDWWWLATPNSTPSGCGSCCVRFVFSVGYVGYGWFCDCGAVRPFFVLQS